MPTPERPTPCSPSRGAHRMARLSVAGHRFVVASLLSYRNPLCQWFGFELFRTALVSFDDDGDTRLLGLFWQTRDQFVNAFVLIFVRRGWFGRCSFERGPGWRNDL